MTVKVGIPRGLLYYKYYTLWVTFFKHLGAEVILSRPTNKNILNNGTKNSVDDACIPVKVYHGHVLDLKDKVDYIFIPRIMGLKKGEYICPKFCGLPEMIKYSLDDLPEIIDTKIDFTKNIRKLNKTIYKIGSYVCNDPKKIKYAYELALLKYNQHKNQVKKGYIPHDARQPKDYLKSELETDQKKIMIMAHPYIIYDNYLNMNVINKVRDAGLEVITPDMLHDDLINDSAKRYDGKLFWTFAKHLIGTSLNIVDKKDVDGVIYISSFGCGIDSVVAETAERRIRNHTTIPYMLMTLDEHSGEAGFNTRLEAFIDMIKFKDELMNKNKNQNDKELNTTDDHYHQGSSQVDYEQVSLER
ncbi:acyl-CoA dehydratase activase-related protein [Haloplasma contractile]|uniref:CoA enzyme activase uncharacterized domain protein n=1 Tax=Haloplasma contractile SSD-17B TaxID=1033810 RepID=F7PV86_9MOLU|nr:acyl-CoA dehydratase activase-related protein [Haloplasma contractile]ERJ12950.1 CoA enzyme activase uncharacterized domain protein [Haloplasma contractile SSD-17B]